MTPKAPHLGPLLAMRYWGLNEVEFVLKLANNSKAHDSLKSIACSKLLRWVGSGYRSELPKLDYVRLIEIGTTPCKWSTASLDQLGGGRVVAMGALWDCSKLGVVLFNSCYFWVASSLEHVLQAAFCGGYLGIVFPISSMDVNTLGWQCLACGEPCVTMFGSKRLQVRDVRGTSIFFVPATRPSDLPHLH